VAFTLTYNTLVEQIINYCERTDEVFENTIPVLVTYAMDRISKDAKLLGGEKYIVGTFTPDLEVLDKPSLWRMTLTFNVGNGENNNTRNQVELRSYEFCTQFNQDRSVTGLPQYYCDYGFNRWLVVPTPDAAYPFEIAYMESFGPLDSSNQTNWLTQNAPQVFFYACMLEAMIYLKNDDRAAFWEDKYAKAMGSLLQEDKDRVTDRYNQRDKD
jgi:hypothetical protein